MTKRYLKAYENRGLVLSIAAASLLLGLVGCGAGGGSSDPTSDYKDLNANVPPHTETARPQEVSVQSYFIEPEKDATAIEGESFSFKIRVRMQFDVTSYDLKLIGVPSDVSNISLARLSSEPNTFVMTWNPPKGIIPTNRQERQIKYRLELANVKSEKPDVEKLYSSVNKVQDFSFPVRRTGKTPTIVVLNSVPAEVQQGQVAKFSVDVLDPASYEGYAPRLDVYFQGTNKTEGGYEANGATYIQPEGSPKHIGGGVWRFSYVFDTANNDVGAQLDRDGKRVEGATHLQTRYFMKAYSANGGVSSEKLVNTKIKFMTPQLAVIQPLAEIAAAKAAAKATKAQAAAEKKAAAPVKSNAKSNTKSTAKSSKPAAKSAAATAATTPAETQTPTTVKN